MDNPLAKMAQQFGVNLPYRPDPAKVPLERLRGMPPTKTLERAHSGLCDTLAQLDAPENTAPDNLKAKIRPLIQRDLEAAAYRLLLARRRDEIAALRPEGCWCLGEGGEGQCFQPGYQFAEPHRTFQRFCGCAEGRAAYEVSVEFEQMIAWRVKQGALDRALAGADVPPKFRSCSFASYPVQDGNRLAYEAVLQWACGPGEDAELADVEFWRATRGHGLLLLGDNGTGKTGLALSVLRHRAETRPCSMAYVDTCRLFDQLRATFSADDGPTQEGILRTVLEVDLLLLDDIAAEKPTPYVKEKLFRIVNERYIHERETIYTVDKPLGVLTELLEPRIVQRIQDMSLVVDMFGAPCLRDTQ